MILLANLIRSNHSFVEIKRSKEEADKALQPLQRYELSQLKLVAIIWNIDNPRALVED